jgi:UDP-glucose 4-epimerase
MNVNIQGTINILEHCRSANIKKFVYAASSSCYGLASVPTKENHKISNMYPYALSKYLGEQSALHWSKVYNIPLNSIRIFNAYGKRVRTTGAYGAVFGVFFKQILENQPLTIVGDGKQRRDFIYVTDLVRAFYLAAKTKYNRQIYNVGAGNPQSINKLVNLIGGKKIVYLPKRPGEPECTWANISKIIKELKWKPRVSFEEGVKLMVNDINNWKKAPLWNKKNINQATKTWFKYMGK